jgi:lipopolysaccharide transport system permease protein
MQGDCVISTADQSPQDWDLVITADSRAAGFDIGELWRYRDLLRLFIRRDFVAFYKQTILGPVWIFIQPLLTSLVYVLIFHRLAGLSTDQLPPIMFYLAGVSCWTFFADCLTKTSETFIANALLYEKVYFPRLITPLSVVASSMIRLVFQLGLFACLWVWYVTKGVIVPSWMLLTAPLLVILLAAMGLGVGLIFAAATNKYRDLRFLMQFGIPLLMFATPVLYPLSMVSEKTRAALSINPLAPVFEAFRAATLGVGDVSPVGLAWSGAFAVLMVIVGTSVFRRVERTFIDTV